MKDCIRTWLTEQFGADEDLFAELYGQYAADMKTTAGELDALLSAGDLAAIGEKGHAMKGMALQVGDNEVAEACLKLQNAGRAGNPSDCAAQIPSVCELVAAL